MIKKAKRRAKYYLLMTRTNNTYLYKVSPGSILHFASNYLKGKEIRHSYRPKNIRDYPAMKEITEAEFALAKSCL